MNKTLDDFKHVKIDLFSKVREQSSGDIIPPTKEEFSAIWNKYNGHFTPGINVNEKRLALIIGYAMPDIDNYPKEFNDKSRAMTVLAWTRMIISFNMNYEVKQNFGISPNERIDFIGSTKHKNEFKKDFNGCNILFLEDDILEALIVTFEVSYEYDQNIENEDALEDFEEYIYDIHSTIGI